VTACRIRLGSPQLAHCGAARNSWRLPARSRLSNVQTALWCGCRWPASHLVASSATRLQRRGTQCRHAHCRDSGRPQATECRLCMGFRGAVQPEPALQAVPATRTGRLEHRAHPDGGAGRLGQQPRPPHVPVCRVDLRQAGVQVVVAQHDGQVAHRVGPGVVRLDDGTQPGRAQRVRGRVRVDPADRVQADRALRGAARGRGGIDTRALPVAQRGLVVRVGRRAHGHDARVHQPADHHRDLFRGHPGRDVTQQPRHVTGTVQQRRHGGHGRAVQHAHPVLGEQEHPLTVGDLDAQVSLEPHPRCGRAVAFVFGMPGNGRLHRTLPR